MSDYWTHQKLDALGKQLDRVLLLLGDMKAKEDIMSGELQTLQTQVAANTSVEQSAITLLQGLKAALDSAIASGNPAALTDLSHQLATSQTALAAAVVANTPAASPPP